MAAGRVPPLPTARTLGISSPAPSLSQAQGLSIMKGLIWGGLRKQRAALLPLLSGIFAPLVAPACPSHRCISRLGIHSDFLCSLGVTLLGFSFSFFLSFFKLKMGFSPCG